MSRARHNVRARHKVEGTSKMSQRATASDESWLGLIRSSHDLPPLLQLAELGTCFVPETRQVVQHVSLGQCETQQQHS